MVTATIGKLWSPIYGPPMALRKTTKAKRPSIWDARPGGVAILAKRPIPIQKIDGPFAAKQVKDAAQRLLKTKRFVQVGVGPGTGRCLVRIAGIYGDAEARTKKGPHARSERLLADALLVMMAYGDTPCMIGGDANTLIPESEVATQALSSGFWHDAAEVDAAWRRGTPLDACFGPNGSSSRIDWILLNGAALAASRGLQRVDNSPLATHRPLICHFDWAASPQLIPFWVRPFRLPPLPGLPEDEETAFIQEVLADSQIEWDLAMQQGNPEQQSALLSSDAEAFLLRCARLEGPLPHPGARYKGRGHVPRTQMKKVSAPRGSSPLERERSSRMHWRI